MAINFSEETRKRLLPFLKEYLTITGSYYDSNQNLTSLAICEAIKMLVKEGVFEKEELMNTILRAVDVLIPVKLIDEIIQK